MSNLERLSEKVFIHPSYVDKMGQTHVATPTDKRTILDGIDMPSPTEEAAEEHLRGLEDKKWGRLTDTVKVVEEDRDIYLALHIPADLNETKVHWDLKNEAGETQSGEAFPATMREKATHMLNGVKMFRYIFRLPLRPAAGYYELTFSFDGHEEPRETMFLVVAPDRCYLPTEMDEDHACHDKMWGVPVQLYALRSKRNWGIGDFTDLQNLTTVLADMGANIVGLNPLSALFPDDPESASPYRSTDRRFLNYMYLDVESIPDFKESAPVQRKVADDAFQAKLEKSRELEWIDYTVVAELKTPILRELHGHFKQNNFDYSGNPKTERAQDYLAFCEGHGENLRNLCLFQALSVFIGQGKPAPFWGDWPEEYKTPDSPAVKHFEMMNKQMLDFYAYLQWETDRQMGEAAKHCKDCGMKIGLYPDQPIGVSDHGNAVWSNQDMFANDYSIGAPPDLRRPKGQTWGFAPMKPLAMKDGAYTSYRQFMGRNMSHAGALRIDHVMGLERLFWVSMKGRNRSVADDDAPISGAYVGYTRDDLMGLIALESQRKKCIIIGEDLGTVRPGFREWLYEKGILSSKILFRQEDKDGNLLPPSDYFHLAVAQSSTHDQPTIYGWWVGQDIETFNDCNLYINQEQYEETIAKRVKERHNLLDAMEKEGVWPKDTPVERTDAIMSGKEIPLGLLRAVTHFLAKTPSAIVLVRLTDVLKETHMVNVPGTDREYPNWRLKLKVNIEDLPKNDRLKSVSDIMGEENRN